MISMPALAMPRRVLVIPLAAISLWICSQNSCAPEPDLHPGPASAIAEAPPPHPFDPPARIPDSRLNPADRAIPPSSGQTKRSLNKAAQLLMQAAEVLGKNERLAVQLIRQAIAILKYEIIREADAPTYDRVSVQPAPSRHEATERRD